MLIDVFLMSGAGNTFTVFDNRKSQLSVELISKLSSKLCNSFEKFETEGLMALNYDDNSDFNIQFFNPDGTSGMMCGNGGRCAVRFAQFLKIINKKVNISFSMANKIYNAEISRNYIKLEFEKPLEILENIEIKIDGSTFYGDFLNVGSDHFCLYISEIKNRKQLIGFTSTYGSKIRNHIEFKRGANANIFYINNNKIHLATFERGVEKITGACGTGAISTALSAVKKGLINFPVSIYPPSNEKLIIDIDGNISEINKLYLIGNAKILKSKFIEI